MSQSRTSDTPYHWAKRAMLIFILLFMHHSSIQHISSIQLSFLDPSHESTGMRPSNISWIYGTHAPNERHPLNNSVQIRKPLGQHVDSLFKLDSNTRAQLLAAAVLLAHCC